MPIDLPTFAASVAAAGGGAAAIAYGAFKAFGAKWMDNRFARQLEANRQAHETETERLRFRIASLLDRVTKLNQREFEVLPDIWAKADEAHHTTAALVSRWREYPDFMPMGDGQLEEVLKAAPFDDWQKGELRALPKHQRSDYYGKTMRWVELHRAQLASYAFSSAVSKGGIYLHPDTYKAISAFATMIYKVVIEWKLDVQFKEEGGLGQIERKDDPIQNYRANGQKEFDALGKLLRERYWEGAQP